MDAELSRLSEQVAATHAAGRSLVIRGGGTRAFYGEPFPDVDDASVLDVSNYTGVVGYEPSEMVLTARAGTLLSEIEALLASRGQMLAFEPPRFGAADTLGGCIATGLSGPRRMATGALSGFVLGTRVLNADGKVLHFGGEVMKNVAGYDVSRLMAGSLGILGALVEVSLKVVPQPRREATLRLELDEAAALMACMEWRSRPLPISATAWLADPSGQGGRLTVRLSGNASAVDQGIATVGGEPLADAQADAFWSSLRDQTHAFFAQRPLWRIALPPRTGTLDLGVTLHEWGGTLRWLAGPADAAAVRAKVQELGGSACLYRREGAAGDVPVFHPLAPGVMQIHRRLKQQFDPDGVFNRNRLIPDL